MIHLDTHVLIWLFDGRIDLLPDRVQRLIEEGDLVASPMARLELDYLHEVGRLRVTGAPIVEDLGRRMGLALSPASFGDVVAQAAGLSWTRDPFDRLIVGNAMADGCPLLTADGAILEHFGDSSWG